MLVACHRVTDKKYNGSKKEEESSKEETSIVFFVFLNRSASWRNDLQKPILTYGFLFFYVKINKITQSALLQFNFVRSPYDK